MRFRLIFSFVLLVSLLLSCSSDNQSSAYDPSDEMQYETHEGMIFVPSKGKSIVLGSNASGVLAKEAHELVAKFDYGFFIDKHEVTCGEYNEFAEKSHRIACENDLLPASNVTFYDAVLYANERSKSEKRDTAYSYTSATFDADGNCTMLENLNFHPENSSYRLPTEAEWMFAANQGWNLKNSWHGENADQETHKVCSKSFNALGICDMEGNVKEWVNDWMGYFKDTTLINFMGASNGSNLGERVVKGGSYMNAPGSIKIYHRGDTYAVTSSTKAGYVGFRLAYGPVRNGLWMDANGNASENEFFVEVSASTIREKTGTYRAKLAFRNDIDGNLVFVDFNAGRLVATEIVDTIDSYHPDISPDGTKIAFCTGMESIQMKSKLYVRNLNAMGSGLVELDVESAAIPRWKVLENGDTVIVYVSDAGDNKDSENFESASTWQVPFANGKFGKPQKLFDGAYHGGVSDDGTLAVTGSRLLRARVDGEDQIWYNEEQACNVSLSKDGSKRTLFLDFGSATGAEFVGKKYSTHQRVLVADSAGKLIQSVEAPPGYTFDHSEWSANDLMVATLTNGSGAHSKLVLVDMVDSSVTTLVSGEEVWHPCLWVDSRSRTIDPSYDADSAGVYFFGNESGRVSILRYRMENYWKNRDSANVVILGSSRSSNGVDSSYFSEGLLAMNLSYFPSSFMDTKSMFDRYVDGAVPRLKFLIVSLDLDIVHFNVSENFFFAEYKNSPGFTYDENHDFWKDVESTESLYEATRSSRGDPIYEFFASNRSTEFALSSGWSEDPEVEKDSTWVGLFKDEFNLQMDALKELAQKGYENGFHVIAVIFPISPGYAKTGAFGRHGLQRSLVPAIMDTLDAWQKKYPSLIVMDENKMGAHDYTDDMAQDCDHLNKKGAALLTTRLNKLLNSL